MTVSCHFDTQIQAENILLDVLKWAFGHLSILGITFDFRRPGTWGIMVIGIIITSVEPTSVAEGIPE